MSTPEIDETAPPVTEQPSGEATPDDPGATSAASRVPAAVPFEIQSSAPRGPSLARNASSGPDPGSPKNGCTPCGMPEISTTGNVPSGVPSVRQSKLSLVPSSVKNSAVTPFDALNWPPSPGGHHDPHVYKANTR